MAKIVTEKTSSNSGSRSSRLRMKRVRLDHHGGERRPSTPKPPHHMCQRCAPSNSPAAMTLRTRAASLLAVRHRAKKNCSGRALPGLRSGQSLPSVVGTLRNRVLATTTPCTIGVRPIVPISQRLSTQMRNNS